MVLVFWLFEFCELNRACCCAKRQAEIAATMAELRLDLTGGTGYRDEEEAEVMEKLWTTQPYSKNQNIRRMDRASFRSKHKSR